MPGMLRIKGTIALEQFWPTGESDADTTKIRLNVGPGSFSFALDHKTFKTTRVFEDAYSLGTGRKKLVDKSNRITVRLQGIDAPELHFSAAPLKDRPEVTKDKRKNYNAANKKRRQKMAETSTLALAKKLKSYKKLDLACTFYSLVDHPYEVVDTYGRFVGSIVLTDGTDVNVWLAENGWAYPTFYSSMENSEIETFLKAMKKAGRKNCVKYYSSNAAVFDPKLLYRGKGAVPDPESDRGSVLMPKLYRRQVAYRMEQKAKVFAGSFKSFLESRPDKCYRLKEFLDKGIHSATQHNFHEFVAGNVLKPKVHEIVFGEKDSTVVDTNGKVIKDF